MALDPHRLDALPGIPGSARPFFKRLLAAPPSSTAQLRAELDDFMDDVSWAVTKLGHVDIDLARAIAHTCHKLLDDVDRQPLKEAERRVIQAAVRYFILEEDGEDTATAIGFEDDIAVINAVLAALERPDWTLPRGR